MPTAIAYNGNLRTSENGSLMVPNPGRLFTPAHLQFQPHKLWNTFHTSVKQANSLYTFKRALIEHVSF